jgi:hypothetical protein
LSYFSNNPETGDICLYLSATQPISRKEARKAGWEEEGKEEKMNEFREN